MPSRVGLFTGSQIYYLGGGAPPPVGGGGGAPPPVGGGGGAPLAPGGGGAPGPRGAGTKALLSIRTVLLEASTCGGGGGPPVALCGAAGTGAALRASGEICGASSMVGC